MIAELYIFAMISSIWYMLDISFKGLVNKISILCYVLAVKIGRPGYRVTKQYDPELKQRSLLFQVRKHIVVIFELFLESFETYMD